MFVKYQHVAHCVKSDKYGVISGPYFPVFSPNTGKYGPKITPYLDTFHVVTSVARRIASFAISSPVQMANTWVSSLTI